MATRVVCVAAAFRDLIRHQGSYSTHNSSQLRGGVPPGELGSGEAAVGLQLRSYRHRRCACAISCPCSQARCCLKPASPPTDRCFVCVLPQGPASLEICSAARRWRPTIATAPRAATRRRRSAAAAWPARRCLQRQRPLQHLLLTQCMLRHMQLQCGSRHQPWCSRLTAVVPPRPRTPPLARCRHPCRRHRQQRLAHGAR